MYSQSDDGSTIEHQEKKNDKMNHDAVCEPTAEARPDLYAQTASSSGHDFSTSTVTRYTCGQRSWFTVKSPSGQFNF